MSETERSSLPQDKTIRQVTSLSRTITGNHLAFVALGVYLAIQTKGAWQAYAIVLLASSAFIGALIATNLIQRGQLRRGGWVLFTTSWIAPAFAAWVLADFSLVSIGFILISTYFIITLGMTKETRRTAWINTAFVLLIPIAARIIDPTWRLVSAFMLTAAPIITAIMGIALLFIIIQRALTRGNIRTKLLVPTLLFIALLIAAIIGYNDYITVQQFNADEESRLEIMHDIFIARVLSDEDFAVALALQTAQNTDIQEAFAKQDRERLIELTLPSYEELDARFGVPQHQFHLPPATSFLRLHNLDNYGDDLSTFRFTVLQANNENRVVSGLEVGRGGVGIRGVAPINYEGQHVGTVEFGLNVDQTLLDTLKNEYGYDFQLGISKDAAEIATLSPPEAFSSIKSDQIFLLATTLTNPFLADENNYIQALAGTHALTHLTIDNNEYAVHTVPLVDFSGKVVGTLDIVSDYTAIVTQQRNQIILSLAILIGALLVIGAGFFFIANQTLRPIGTLTASANAIAAGDFTKTAKVESDDELGVLATTFNSMAAQIEESVRTLEDRVAERTKAQETVAEIATTTATIIDADEMLTRMVHLTQRGFGLYHAHVFTYDASTENLQIVACGFQEGDPNEGTHETGVIPLTQERSLVARAARSRQAIIINDVRNEEGWLPNPLLPETRAEMAVPLIVGNELLGVLDVQSEHLDAFSKEDANIQTTLASQVAVALKNSTSYAESLINEKLLADALKISRLGNWTYDVHQDIFTFNDQFYAVFRTTAEEAGGYELTSADYAQKYVHPEDVPMVGESIQAAMESKERIYTANLEHRGIFPDGTTGYITVSFTVERDQDGNIIRWSGANQDITERRSLEIEASIRAKQQTTINTISQKIQQTDTIEEAMKIAARELGRALGSPQTLVALNTSALTGDDEVVSNVENPETPELTETGVEK